jgi:stage V sporulation protein AB
MDAMILIVISLSGGIAVGTSVTSFLVALDIIPRLMQLTKTSGYSLLYEIVVILGMVTFTLSYLLSISIPGKNIIAGIFGIFMGFYIGVFAAALTEVLNVIPIMTKRMNIKDNVIYIIIVLSLGKVVGSLIYWIFPQIYN